MCLAPSKRNVWCRPELLGVFVSSSLLGDRFPVSGTARPLPWRVLLPSDLNVRPTLAEQLTGVSTGPSSNTSKVQMGLRQRWLPPFRLPPAHLEGLCAPVADVRRVESCGSVCVASPARLVEAIAFLLQEAVKEASASGVLGGSLQEP